MPTIPPSEVPAVLTKRLTLAEAAAALGVTNEVAVESFARFMSVVEDSPPMISVMLGYFAGLHYDNGAHEKGEEMARKVEQLQADNETLTKGLEAIAKNPGAHPGNMVGIARETLDKVACMTVVVPSTKRER